MAVSDNQALDLNFTSGLFDLVKKIKDDIEEAVVDIKNHPEDLYHENNVALLRRLAFKGNNLFVNHLKKKTINGPIQIVARREEFVPLDFVYTLPPPKKDAQLCTHAKEALEEGACKKCYDHILSPAPHICPFGFWCFSQVVERHRFGKGKDGAGDYRLQSEPITNRGPLNVLQETVYASTSKVEKESNGLRDRILKAITKNSLHVYEAQDWNSWSDLTSKHKPDSMILVVHIEKDDENDVDQLEIGDKQLIVQNSFDHVQIGSPSSEHPPFIIVIGCETASVENYGFDISSQLITEGAAVVLSNFTKIRGRHAGPIVIKLVEYLKENAGKEISFGSIILKLRQYLLSKGIMVSLALVAHGDADWKIKT